MTKKFKIRRIQPAAVEPEPEAESKVDVPVQAIPMDEVVGITDASDYVAMSIPQLRQELSALGLDSSGRKSEMVKRLLADSAKSVAEKASDGFDGEDTIVGTTFGHPSLKAIVEALYVGRSVLVTRINDNQWQIELAESANKPEPKPVRKPKSNDAALRGDSYNREVLSPEYYQFMYDDAGDGRPWDKMSIEEKVAFADKRNITFDTHKDNRVTMLSLFRAVTAYLGIGKYKPEYNNKAARDALKE